MQFIWAIGLLVASAFIQALLIKRQDQKPAALGDFNFPVAEVGSPQSIIFGDCWTPDWMVLWYGNFDSRPIKK
jgi:hypothetical protein